LNTKGWVVFRGAFVNCFPSSDKKTVMSEFPYRDKYIQLASFVAGGGFCCGCGAGTGLFGVV
jgi:hypothetical protein